MSSAQSFQALTQAGQLLAQGDIAAAERIAQSLLAGGPDADALHLMGVVRAQQQKPEEAAKLMAQSLALKPHQPRTLFNFGKILSLLGLHEPAATAFCEAVRLEPALAEGWFELGNAQSALGEMEKAEASYRAVLARDVSHAPALLALSALLIAVGRAAEAETLLCAARVDAGDAPLAARFGQSLALARQKQGRKQEALDTLAKIRPDPASRTDVEAAQIYLLEDLGRHDEALGLLRGLLDREPLNVSIHNYYNDLLYRLGRDREFLSSYDQAPFAVPLQLDKAMLLLSAGRLEEARATYAGILSQEPGNHAAVAGAANTSSRMGQHQEAIGRCEQALAQAPDDSGLLMGLAEAALRGGDPGRAASAAQKGLAARPYDQNGLALLGTAWRLLQDERDEDLNGYDDFIRVLDLDPPEGFSDMTAFNAELSTYLERQHPPTREFITQSLRGGTQMRGVLFNAGHDLVDKLQVRINQAVKRYVDEMRQDSAHPFLSRRRAHFSYSGSWSSLLRDCGFHVNHFHPAGWISSCYYAGVPDVVEDAQSRQGWIKFGEPPFDTGLGFRRAVQPAPGRLVLFPSYMWHGTIPFRSGAVRTTIAFDAVPR